MANWRKKLTQHIYNFQELEDAAVELAAMRVAQNADYIRHLHKVADRGALLSEFNNQIEHTLMVAPRMRREPNTGRLVPMLVVSLLTQALWDAEEELLKAEPEHDLAPVKRNRRRPSRG